MAAREHDYQPGDTIRGDGAEYLVQAVLGSGGMGAVYLVKDKNIGRLFVLKVLHRSLAHRRDLIERFEVEARALGHLSHPGIIEIFQLNRTRDDQQMPYYLMEVLTGESLADSLRRHRKLDLFTALGIATKLLHALDHAHERGIVHRDIKPDNIFLHRGPSSEPVVKLLDFGILKLVASEENPGIFIGTPRYCAPEQLKADPSIGPKADLYSVGVVLFQMLTSHLPFEGYGGSLKEMVHTLVVEAPPISKHGTFPPALVALVASALAKEPDQRPADAFTFASELRSIRRAFAPDREDPHTHVTAEVIAEPGRPQRDASQITIAHLAAPTAPDADMGKLMDALRADAGGAVADVLRDVENQPPVSITGFESTAKDPVAAASSPSPEEPAAFRDAITALPRSASSERAPGSVRYVTKEAAAPSPSGQPVVQQTVPMARPLRAASAPQHTAPMAGRPGRFAHPITQDGRTPGPQAIDQPRPAPRPRPPSGLRRLSRIRRRIERFVPLRALPVALALGFLGWLIGMQLLRRRGVELDVRATTPAAASVARAERREDPPAPAMTVAAPAVPADAGVPAPAVAVAVVAATAPPTPSVPKQPARAAAPSASPLLVPVKKTSTRPEDIGF